MSHNGSEEFTPPATPNTLGLLRACQDALEESRGALARTLVLLAEVEKAIRFEVRPLSDRMTAGERRLTEMEERFERAQRTTDPAPAPGE